MGLVTPGLRMRVEPPSSEPTLTLRLEPSPFAVPRDAKAPAGGAAASARSAAPARSPSALTPPVLHRPPQAAPVALPPVPDTPSRPLGSPTRPAASSPAPSGPATASRAGAAKGAARSDGPGQGSDGDAGAAAMRSYGRVTIGCDTAALVHLSPVERDRCNQRFGEQARRGPAIDPIPREERAAYDAAAENNRKCRHYDTPMDQAPGTERSARIERSFDRRTPASQHKESTAVLPDEGLLSRWGCWFR